MSRLKVNVTEQVETTFTIEKPGDWDDWAEDRQAEFLENLVGKEQQGLRDYESNVVERDTWARPVGYHVTDWRPDSHNVLVRWCELIGPRGEVVSKVNYWLTATSPAVVTVKEQAEMDAQRGALVTLCETANKGLEK